MPCYAFQGIIPVVDPSSYLHPLAVVIGDVIIGPGCYVGPGACLRGDFGRIIVEGDSSIQDSATVHVSSLRDTMIGRGATIAHGAIVHGCEIGENCLIGMNAVVLDDVTLGAECLVAALALIKGGMVAPPRSLLVGSPARIVRTLSPEEVNWRNDGDGDYQRLARQALDSLVEIEPLRAVEPRRQRIQSGAIPIRLGTMREKDDS